MNQQKLKPAHIASLLFSFFLICLFTSCATEGTFEEGPRTILPESQEILTVSIYGRVVDEDDRPIESAAIDVLSGFTPYQIESDEDGYFLLNNFENKGNSAFIKVRSPGKFAGFRRLSLVPRRRNYTEIKMLDKVIAGEFNASSGGLITHSSGALIEVGEDAVTFSNGSVYSGTVQVAMAYIDPLAPDLSQRMIGDLSGIDQDGALRSLSSVGMIQVELYDNGGSELSLDPLKGARLVFPIPDKLVNQTDNSVPLWSYDEVVGTWIQEGFAQKEGNTYSGQVFHFSSWNVDFMTDPIEITGQVLWQIEDGSIGGSFLSIYVCSEEIGRKGGWLCEDGSFRFYNFPKDEEFKLKIINHCGDEIYVESYGPFNENKDLGEINVSTNENIVKVSGNALNCNEDPVSNAVLSVLQEGRNLSFPVADDGSFEFSVDFCDQQTALLTIVDLDEEKSSSTEINGMNSVIELTDILICDDLLDFISFSINEDPAILLTPNIRHLTFQDSLVNGSYKEVSKIYYEIEDSSGYSFFELIFCAPDSVPSEVQSVRLNYYSNQLQGIFAEEGITVNITRYDNFPGGTIEGSFNGTVFNETTGGIEEKTISGSFKVPIR